MRKFLFLFFLCQSLLSFAQTTNSVLANGTWHKFSVDTTGVFKIDYNFLQQIGLTPNSINPKNIKIYGNGGSLLPNNISDFKYDDLQENAILVSGEEDNAFNSNDYILFYAKGPHDWNIKADNSVTHRQNIYTDKAFYFITVDNGPGKRINTSPEVTTNTSTQINTFDDFIFYEKEIININAIGQDWFGENFDLENTHSFEIPFPNFVANSQTSIRVRAAGISSTSGSGLNITVNGANNFNINFPQVLANSLTKGYAIEETNTFNNPNDNIKVDITYNNGGNPSAKAYLDYIEIVGKKRLKATEKQFPFRSFDAKEATGIVEFQIENSNLISQLWDVTDFINPKKVENQSNGNNFTFKANGGSLSEYIIINESDYYTPNTVENSLVTNQNLHSLKDINYIAITTEKFSSKATRLTNYHSEKTNLTTKVVLLDQIYNEFGSGSPDVTAIRNFLHHIYTNNTSPIHKLQYVCFLGDASYDYKDRISNNTNIVPVYLANRTQGNSFNLANSYVTDDYFVMLDNNEGSMNTSHTIDVASSRIPVNTIQQASDVVDKILSYYQPDKFGDWRNKITLVTDDSDATGEQTIQEGMERIADSIKDRKPIFNVSKIYADAYVQQNSSGGERYPEVNTALLNTFEKGSLVIDYFGHGGEDGLASERILGIPEITSLNNIILPLFVTVTCDFTRFDNPLRTTAGERIFWQKNGGAASLITTTREVFISVGQTFNEELLKLLLGFNGEDNSIAQTLVRTKNITNTPQKFFIFSLGDPAMKLAVPKPNINITKMNGVDITQSLDTLKALSKVSFEGIVTDNNNVILNNFNGTVSTTVFDKPIDKTTLDNNNFGYFLTFDSQESKLFRGKASVTNGIFKFDFIVPRDVKIAYGKGKLSFYAENKQIDKSGANFDVVVGGINENAPEDTVGPEIKLFINDESFIDGGNTNSSPNFIANLADISGINTSITAVDHDIVIILDGDQTNPIILNDFYETELDDFTKGKATYKLRNLSVGSHTITLKAWDTYNNSSEATLNFMVVSDTTLQLDNVLNYPNPFINYTEFWFNHNKPNEPLQGQVQIFTVSGKLIKTINQNIQTTGSLSRSITWNGLDDFGNKIGKGVYIYKLQVKSTISNLISEKYEKLVILQ